MKIQKQGKRALSFLLAVCMIALCIGTVPVSAAQQETEEPPHGEEIWSADFSGPDGIADWSSSDGYTADNGTLSGICDGSGKISLAPEDAVADSNGDYVVTAKVALKLKKEGGSSAGIVFRAADGNNFLHLRLNYSPGYNPDVELYRWKDNYSSKLKSVDLDWQIDSVYTLAVLAEGKTIRCYVDGSLLIEYTDEGYNAEANKVGLRTYNTTMECSGLRVYALKGPDPNAVAVKITEPAAHTVLSAGTTSLTVKGTVNNASNAAISLDGGDEANLAIADNSFTHTFNSLTSGNHTIKVTATGAEGETAEAEQKFRVAAPAKEGAYTFEGDDPINGWTGDTGFYSIVDQMGNHVLKGESSDPALILVPTTPEQDSYRLSTEISITSETGTCSGIVFRYRDASDFWYFRLENSGKAVLYEEKAGDWNAHDSVPIDFATNVFYDLAVEADGPYINCYVDGELVVSYVDTSYTEPEIPGQIGFRVVKCTSEFDNLTVDKVTAPPSPTVEVPDKPVTTAPVTLTGTAENASQVILTANPVKDLPRGAVKTTSATPDEDGNYSARIYLPNGTYTIAAQAVSIGGHGVSEPETSGSFEVKLPPMPLTAKLDRSMQVPVEGPISVIFSAPVDESTLDGKITLEQGGQLVEAEVTVDETDQDGFTVLVTPNAPLNMDTEYQVKIGAEVKDVMDNSVDKAGITLSFHTKRDLDNLAPLSSEWGESVIPLNGMWKFVTDPDNRGEAAGWYTLEDTNSWDTLRVPGNWDLENAYANYRGYAWYGRTFQVPEEYAGYPVYLELTAVYHNCTIWINGQKVGSHDGGYTTFQFRVDEFLRYGENDNTIAILVDNIYSVGAWWKWGGISGDALLRVNNAVKMDWQHISSDQDTEAKTATLSFEYQFVNWASKDKKLKVESKVYDRDGSEVGSVTTDVTVKPSAETEENQRFTATLSLSNVNFWNLTDPYLYTVKTWAQDESGNTVHYVQDNIGIRKIEIKDTKFYLNGEQMRLTGADRVWDDRANGQTEPEYVIMRDIDYMKSMGMSCARMSHVPMSENLLDYCDEVGFLLICESNVWGTPPAKVGDDSYRSVPWYTEMIERNFNHPAIFAWSIGNEMHGGNQNTKDYAQFMVRYIKENLDNTRFVTEVSLSAQNPNNPENPEGDSVYYSDFICCNFYGSFKQNVEKIHTTYPEKAIFVSEYGNSQTSEVPDKANINPQNILNQWGDLPYVFGASIWTLNDYRSNYGGTPLGQNRVWGVTTVWGDKKIGFETLRKASSPVKSLTIGVAGDTQTEDSSAIILLGIQVRDLESELPAYALRNALAKWEALDGKGNVLSSGILELPELLPDGGTHQVTATIRDIPAGGVGAIRATVIDAQGYEIAESFLYLQAPGETPEITGVIIAGTSARVIFDGVPNAEEYAVTIKGADKTSTVTAKMNRYVEFTGLTAGETYSFTIAAKNSTGEGEPSDPVEATAGENTEALPPIIWHTEPIEGGFFVGYAVTNSEDTYELHYGTVSGNYTDSITFNTEGAVKVSGLTGGQTYYYQLRSVSNGVPSAWSQEIAVTPEVAAQKRTVPAVKGAAAGEHAVSLTIDPTWKATGYTVHYGESADALNESIEFHRAEVEQLTISGLETGKTYYFSVASQNGTVLSDFSKTVSSLTTPTEAGEVVVASVDTKELSFTPFDTKGNIAITAASTYSDEKTLTVSVEGLPVGLSAQGEMTFSLEPNSGEQFFIPIVSDGKAHMGRYCVTVSILDGGILVVKKEVNVVISDAEVLINEEFSTDEDRFSKSGSGNSTATVSDGKLTVECETGASSPILVTGELDWSDCIIESNVHMVNRDHMDSGVSAGLVFRYQDDKNFWHVRIDNSKTGEHPSFQVYSWENGVANDVYSQPLSSNWNDSYHIRVVDEGEQVHFYLNGIYVTTLTLGEGSGKVGYRAYGVTVELDNFRVYRLITPADKTELAALVESCEQYAEEDYTADSYANLEAALAEAETVLNDPDALQDAVDKALEELKTAIEGLKKKPTVFPPVPSASVNTPASTNGTYTVNDRNAKAGDTVTVTPNPNEGFVVDQVVVTDKNGNEVPVTDNGDGTYSFVMPDQADLPVTVKVTFKEDDTEKDCPSANYTDVDQTQWYHEGVDYAIANGLMDGVALNTFAPNGTTTRAMVVMILYRLDGKPAATASAFADVPAGQWYTDAIGWAAANGVVDGYSPERFGPNDPVTREQMAAILYRYADYKGYDVTNLADLSDFTDAGSVGGWASDAIRWAVGAGLIEGRTPTTLVPGGNSTRAEVATLLMRFCESVMK